MTQSPQRKIEMLHVVYADAVGYSALSLAEKSAFDSALAETVSQVQSQYEPVARVDNGDGFALVFRGDPAETFYAAEALFQGLRARSSVAVRFGIHSGTGYLREDLSGSSSISGHAIEFAQRIMSLSDGSAILCSSAFRLALDAYPELQRRLGYPLFGRSKNGNSVVAYPILTGAQKSVAVIGSPHDPVVLRFATELRTFSIQIVPDVQFITLERESLFAGLAEVESNLDLLFALVIVDSGDEFFRLLAESIRDRIRSEVVVVPVTLSSEVEDEVVLGQVRKCAQAIWPDSTPKPTVGGVVPLGSPFYVWRESDRELEAAIDQRESIVLLRGPRRFGKSSAVLRATRRAKDQGIKVLSIDLTAADRNVFADSTQFYRWVVGRLMAQMDPKPALPDWEEWLGPNSNFENAIREMFGHGSVSRLLVFDGVDRLFECDFRDDFFGLLRSWHNRRAVQEEGPWQFLTVLLAYSRFGENLVRDANQSPFNVGRRVDLEPFSPTALATQAKLAGKEDEADRLEALSGGHPALAMELLESLGSVQTISTAELKHVQWVREKLQAAPEVNKDLLRILNGLPPHHATSWEHLVSLGVLQYGVEPARLIGSAMNSLLSVAP